MLVALLVAGCAAGTSAPSAPAATPEASTLAASSPSAAPSTAPPATPTSTPTATPPGEPTPALTPPAGGQVASPEQAAQLVIGSDPRFADFGPLDPNMIGQCCWYEANEGPDGYEVLIHVGWGDCPSGCINQHEWAYLVSPDGQVTLLGESGDPLPAGELPTG